MPHTQDWMANAAYLYILFLDRPAVAWEHLAAQSWLSERLAPLWHEAASIVERTCRIGGYDFFENPNTTRATRGYVLAA